MSDRADQLLTRIVEAHGDFDRSDSRGRTACDRWLAAIEDARAYLSENQPNDAGACLACARLARPCAEHASPLQLIAATPELPAEVLTNPKLGVQQTAQPVAWMITDNGKPLDFKANEEAARRQYGSHSWATITPLYASIQPPLDHTKRWNVEESNEGEIRICQGQHQSGEQCEWQYFVPKSAVQLPREIGTLWQHGETGRRGIEFDDEPRHYRYLNGWLPCGRVAVHDAVTKSSGGENG